MPKSQRDGRLAEGVGVEVAHFQGAHGLARGRGRRGAHVCGPRRLFCFLRGAPCPAWRAGAVVPFRFRWLLGPLDWVCDQFFGANTPPMS